MAVNAWESEEIRGNFPQTEGAPSEDMEEMPSNGSSWQKKKRKSKETKKQ